MIHKDLRFGRVMALVLQKALWVKAPRWIQNFTTGRESRRLGKKARIWGPWLVGVLVGSLFLVVPPLFSCYQEVSYLAYCPQPCDFYT